jgi:hypothetical protein
MRIVESMGLLVKLPMLLEIDSKGVKDLVNNWSLGGRLRHIEVKQCFLQELKEQGLIEVNWLASEDNTSDMMTKHLGGQTFMHHTQTVCGNDEYHTIRMFRTITTRHRTREEQRKNKRAKANRALLLETR